MRDALPTIVLAVETGPHHHLLRMLREGLIDIMVGRMPLPREMSDLSFDHLYEEEVLIVVRAQHPHVDRPVAEVLALSPLVMPPETAIIRGAADAFLALVGLSGARPAFETVSLAVGRGIVLQSDAAWFISRGVVAEDLDSGVMRALKTDARFLSGAVGMTRRQGTHPAPGLELFQAIVRDVALSIQKVR